MSENVNELTQQIANQVAISLNVMFNNATFYGGDHPSTAQNADSLAEVLNSSNPKGEITLIRRGVSLYIDKWCVNDRMNTERLVKAFQKTQIESITFVTPIDGAATKCFIKAFSDLSLKDADSKNEFIQNCGITNVKINYIFYKKVTKDDAVVNSADLEGLTKTTGVIADVPYTPGTAGKSSGNLESYTPGDGPVTSTKDQNESILNELNQMLSLKQMLDNPALAAEKITTSNDSTDFDSQDVIAKIKSVGKQIENRDRESLSSDEMIESVISISSQIKSSLNLQKEMGKIIQEENLVLSEVDKLTYRTVVDLVCEEYKSGKVSVKKLSRLIRRVLPDIKELKKIMPLLKEGLMNEGMELAEFLLLTRELNKELANNEVSEVLAQGADELGLSVNDLVTAMGDDPAESAKLIILASEIKQGGATDSSNLSKLLTDYIEAASSEMVMNNPEENESGETVSKMISEIEENLLGKLKIEGVSGDVIDSVKSELASRFPKTINKFKTDMIVNAISSGGNLSSGQMKGIFGESLPDKSELNNMQTNIASALKTRGFSPEAAEDFFSEITGRFRAPTKRIDLPKTVISSNNTKFFLQRYIKEFTRYENPFSVLNISPKMIVEPDGLRPSTTEDRADIFPVLCTELKKQLRDLDIIGVVGDIEVDPITVLLPMTDIEGTKIVLDRMRKHISELKVPINDSDVSVKFTVTALQYSRIMTPDMKSFLKQLALKHKEGMVL